MTSTTKFAIGSLVVLDETAQINQGTAGKDNFEKVTRLRALGTPLRVINRIHESYITVTGPNGGEEAFNYDRRFLAYVEPVKLSPRRKRTLKQGGRCQQLLTFLLSGRSITQGEAIIIGFGTRLAATVHDLRGLGHDVKTVMKEDIHGNPYAEYRLVTRNRNGDRKAA